MTSHQADDLEATASKGNLQPTHSHEDVPKYDDMEVTARVVDHAAERSLAFKFDIRILPVLAVMCKSCTNSHCLS